MTYTDDNRIIVWGLWLKATEIRWKKYYSKINNEKFNALEIHNIEKFNRLMILLNNV